MSTSDAQHHPRLLEYGCSEWRESSQWVANLYSSGAKFWSKDDLRDIEEQLADSEHRETFTIRALDGSMVAIKNPDFGESAPIW